MIGLTTQNASKQYKYDRDRNHKCSNCDASMKVLYDYVDLPYRLCELCNIVYRYNENSLSCGIICKTNLTQLQIIQYTHAFLKKQKRIPKISEIDPNAKILKSSYLNLLKILRNAPKRQTIKHFADLKLFFTDMIDYKNFLFRSVFGGKIKKYPEYKFYVVVHDEMKHTHLNANQKNIVKMFIR